MAVLYATSFEGGSNTFYTQNGWAIGAGNVVSTLRPHLNLAGIGGTYTLDIDSNTTTTTPGGSTSQRWLHFFMTPRVPGTPTTWTLTFLRSAGATFFVRFLSSGTVELLRGTTMFSATVVATSASPITTGVGHWVAIQLLATNAGGTCEVWVDGVLVVSFSGDCCGAATENWDQVGLAGSSWGSSGNTPDVTIDDLIITDSTTGRVAEQFCQVLLPTSVTSGNLTGSPATGADRWQNVDEGGTAGPTTQASYNSTVVAGDEDLYALSDPAAASSVLCAVVWTEASRAGALTSIENSVESGGTTVYQTPVVLPTTGWQSVPYILETDPDTGVAWTDAGLAGMQAGARFT